MEYTKLIHEFTDGTLESKYEDELFRGLSSNEELRSEFKQQLAMKSAIRLDTKAYTPAAASTLKIFGSVGMVPPAPMSTGIPTGNGVVSGTTIGGATGFFTKYGSSILTGVITTMSTAVIAYFIFQSQMGNLMSENKELKDQIAESKSNIEIPVMKSELSEVTGNEDIPKSAVGDQKPIIKYVYINKEAETGGSQLYSDGMEEEAVSKESDAENNISNNDIPDIFYAEVEPININPMQSDMRFSALNTELNPGIVNFILEPGQGNKSIHFQLELRKMENWFDQTPSISPKEYSKFNNSSISILYEFISGLHIGGEYRRETFFQKFSGLDDEGKRFRYEQQPNFESFGLMLRYSNPEINLWGIYPLGQINYGVTKAGSIVRYMAGISYSPYSRINLILGAEASGLNYHHGGENFESWRYDLNYGISIGF